MTEVEGRARIVTRRTVVASVGAMGLGAALVACGGSSGSAASAPSSGSGSGSGSGSSSGSGGSGGGSAAAKVLAKTSDIPEGGGKIFSDQDVVVTQPTAGEFKAFSATCTHQGCKVTEVSGGLIHCPCHGSLFSVANGAVKGGPAPRPLPAEKITVANGSISLA